MMGRFRVHFIASILLIAVVSFTSPASAKVRIKATVDAEDLYRGLLTASSEYSVREGTYGLYFPKWVEGVHGPNGPVQNLAEVRVSTVDGEPVPWQRDPHEVYHFLIEIPPHIKTIIVDTTYICNQPTANTMGVDTHGNSLLGIICWNTCLLYPPGHDISDIEVDLSLQLPPDWKWAASLTEKKRDGDTVQFNPVSYRELVDSPLICGQYMNTIDITPENGTPHYLHLVSESKHAIHPEEEKIEKLRKMVAEAMVMFGTEHDYDYHFLLVLSDALPFLGLEHVRSSLNAVPENGLDDEQMRLTGHLLTHEYGHRWCGKYHRPAGMATAGHHQPKDTRLLWVYEGLDQYLGVVLTTRSGLFATKEYSSFEGGLRDGWVGVGKTIVQLMRQKGRRSINLEDTASSSHLRRRWGKFWTRLTRPQDYYFEGALLWYEIDAILREESEGKICLDDFVRRFVGRYDPAKEMMSYTEKEVVGFLNDLMPYDWQALIEDRVRGLHDDLPLTVLTRMGYRIEYSNKPTHYDEDPSYTALGIQIGPDGAIQRIVPGSLADAAGLYEGAKIIGVDNRKYSENRLRDAVADSVSTRKIEFLLIEGDRFKTVEIPYAGGPKYVDIVHDPDKTDRFADIFAPRTE